MYIFTVVAIYIIYAMIIKANYNRINTLFYSTDETCLTNAI